MVVRSCPPSCLDAASSARRAPPPRDRSSPTPPALLDRLADRDVAQPVLGGPRRAGLVEHQRRELLHFEGILIRARHLVAALLAHPVATQRHIGPLVRRQEPPDPFDDAA